MLLNFLMLAFCEDQFGLGVLMCMRGAVVAKTEPALLRCACCLLGKSHCCFQKAIVWFLMALFCTVWQIVAC